MPQEVQHSASSPVEQLWVGHETCTHAALLARLATVPWERHSCGAGSQGPRWYDGQRLELNDPPQAGFKRWVVFRRSCTDPTKVTAYRAFGPVGTPLAAQVRVVGRRWTVEERIQTGKSEVELDEYEVRSWTGWSRHITLAMWAQAFLSLVRTAQGAAPAGAEQPGGLQAPPRAPIGLSMGEIRRLLWDLVLQVERQATQILHWSGWRRWHQAWAAWHHAGRPLRRCAAV